MSRSVVSVPDWQVMVLAIVFALVSSTSIWAQTSDSDHGSDITHATGQTTWFPRTQVFEPLILDPLEAQSYGSINRMANQGSKLGDDLYVPFGIGFSKGIWHRTSTKGWHHQINVELTNFTQFEWLVVKGERQRNMLNADYKVGFQYQFGHNDWSFRARWYHLSSHLGDDVFIRRGVSNFQSYTASPANYEMIDFVATRYMGPFRFYAGLGAIARVNSPREQFMYQFGMLFNRHFSQGNSPFHMLAGFDVKGWQYLGYNPSLKAAAGIGYGEGRHTTVALLLEAYAGNLPYGQNEKVGPVYINPVPTYPTEEWGGKVMWVGLGLYVNPVF